MEKVRLIVRNYLKKNVRVGPAHGFVPELRITARELNCKLQRDFKVTLEKLVDDVEAKMIFNPLPAQSFTGGDSPGDQGFLSEDG